MLACHVDPFAAVVSALEVRDLEVVYRDRGRGAGARRRGRERHGRTRARSSGLVGESGCGKSSLARAAVGLDRARGRRRCCSTGGRCRRSDARRAPASDARVQMVFQNPYASLNPRRTIGAQIADGLTLAGVERRARRCTHRRAARRGRDIAGRRRRATRTSSAAASASASRSPARSRPTRPVIVLDEPLSSLDASAQAQVANLLVRLARDRGLGLLLISHDLGIVHHVADVGQRHVPRRRRRDGADARAVGGAAASVHRGADRGDPARRRRRAACPRRCPARCPIRRSRRAAAASIRAARTSSTAAPPRCRRSTHSAASARRRASCATPASSRTPNPEHLQGDDMNEHVPETEYAARRERLAERMQDQRDRRALRAAVLRPRVPDRPRARPAELRPELVRARLGHGRVHRPGPRAAVRPAAHVRRLPPVGATSPTTSSPSTRPTTGARSSVTPLRRSARSGRSASAPAPGASRCSSCRRALPSTRARQRDAARERAAPREVAARARADDASRRLIADEAMAATRRPRRAGRHDGRPRRGGRAPAAHPRLAHAVVPDAHLQLRLRRSRTTRRTAERASSRSPRARP